MKKKQKVGRRKQNLFSNRLVPSLHFPAPPPYPSSAPPRRMPSSPAFFPSSAFPFFPRLFCLIPLQHSRFLVIARPLCLVCFGSRLGLVFSLLPFRRLHMFSTPVSLSPRDYPLSFPSPVLGGGRQPQPQVSRRELDVHDAVLAVIQGRHAHPARHSLRHAPPVVSWGRLAVLLLNNWKAAVGRRWFIKP